MFTRSQALILFVVLTVMVLLGDDKQSMALVIACAGALGLYAYDWYVNKTIFSADKKIVILWAVTGLAILASSLWALSLGYAITEAVKYALSFLFFIYFSNTQRKDSVYVFEKHLYVWALCMVGVSFLLLLFPILQPYIPQMNLLYRAYGHNHIVDILFFVLPISLFMLRGKRSAWTMLGALFVYIGFAISFSRGGLLLLWAYSVYFLATQIKNKHPYKKYVAISVFSILIVAAFYIFSNSNTWRLPSNNFQSITKKATILESRVQYWKQAALAIKERPLLGWGPGSFYLLSKRFQESPNTYSWYAHSFPLQTFSEIGLVGLICLIGLIARILYLARRGPLFHGAVLTILYSAIEMNLDFTVVWVLLWASIGFLSQDASKKQSVGLRAGVLFPLLFVGIYYGANVVGSIVSLFPNGFRLSFHAQPYDVNRALDFIDTSKTKHSISMLDEKIIQLFHGHDPEILLSLAKAQVNINKYNNTMDAAISADPENTSFFIEHLAKAAQTNDTITVNKIIENTSSKHLSSEQKTQLHNFIYSNRSPAQLYMKEVVEFVGSPATNLETLSKIFYFIGLKIVQKHPSDTLFLWTIARDLSPSWGYYHVELASLEAQVFHDNTMLEKTLLACNAQKYARASCRDIQISDYPPGSQTEYIKAIPAIHR